jgi:hypothetical protein
MTDCFSQLESKRTQLMPRVVRQTPVRLESRACEMCLSGWHETH